MFIPAIRTMLRKIAGRCPACGGDVVSTIKKPAGPFIKDGPTTLETRCRKCGLKLSLPLRVGP